MAELIDTGGMRSSHVEASRDRAGGGSPFDGGEDGITFLVLELRLEVARRGRKAIVGRLKWESTKLQTDKKAAQKRLAEIEQAQRRRQQDVLNGDLPTLIATAEGEQLQRATEITELAAQQSDMGTKAQKARVQAKRIQTYIELQCEFSGIDVTLCPRCTKSIDSASIEREADTHECRLCNKTATAASEDDIVRLKLEAADWEAEAKRNQDAQTQVAQRIAALKVQEDGLKKRAEELRASIKAGVSAAYPTPEEDAEKAKLNESLGRIGHQLWHVEQRLGSASGGSEDAEKRAKIVRRSVKC